MVWLKFGILLIFSTNMQASIIVDDLTNQVEIVDGENKYFVDQNNLTELSNVANRISNQEDRAELVKLITKNYKPLTPEEILSAGFKMKNAAMNIVRVPENPCHHLLVINLPEEPKFKKETTDDCYICTIQKEEKEVQTIIAHAKGLDLIHPNQIEFSYSGLNDQPLHGAFEKFKSIGNDLNGHTYGSKSELKLEYDWGDLNVSAGTDLYVSSLDTYVNGKLRHYITNTSQKKFLQTGDEHSYLRVGAKIFLLPELARQKDRPTISPYMKFAQSSEIDSSKGIGVLGAIVHREKWHEMFNVRQNYYLNQFKDRNEINHSSGLGVDTYTPIAGFGLCTQAEAGVTHSSTGRMTAETKMSVSLDSGKYLGGNRQRPVFIVNFQGGMKNPIREGTKLETQIDDTYGDLQTQNAMAIGDLKTRYGSVGVETGSKKVRFSIDAIYEKNKLNDKDILYMTTVKYRFK